MSNFHKRSVPYIKTKESVVDTRVFICNERGCHLTTEIVDEADHHYETPININRDIEFIEQELGNRNGFGGRVRTGGSSGGLGGGCRSCK